MLPNFVISYGSHLAFLIDLKSPLNYLNLQLPRKNQLANDLWKYILELETKLNSMEYQLKNQTILISIFLRRLVTIRTLTYLLM